MSDTTFINGITLTDDDWFNDVNRLQYTVFGDPADRTAGAAFLLSGLTLSASAGILTAGLRIGGTLSATAAAGGIIATKAQQEAGTVATSLVTPSTQQQHNSAAKAWGKVSFSGGTPTLEKGYNAAITDSGLGVSTISMLSAMSGSAYTAIAVPLINSNSIKYASTDALAPASFLVRTFEDGAISATAADVNFSFAVFGPLA